MSESPAAEAADKKAEPPQGDLKVSPPAQGGRPGERARYQGVWRRTVMVTSLVAIAPLLIMAAADYFHDREAQRIENQLSVNRILSTVKRSLSDAFSERRGALSLVIGENPYPKLASDKALASAQEHLQESFGGFVDLGLLDASGRQKHYTGPYDLKGKDYRDQEWFHQVVLRGTYVSDVFMGYRNFPHFIIAARHRSRAGGSYVLRATIDIEVLKSRLHGVELDRRTDAFLLDDAGVLQTDSRFYGRTLENTPIVLPPLPLGKEVVEEQELDGAWVTAGYARIDRTPFVLVVIKRRMPPLQHWVSQRSSLLVFLVLSIAVILGAVLISASNIVSSLREADARRAKALHDLEYTNKLATIGRMAASVAHEINNPLAIINEDAGLLKDIVAFSDGFPKKERTTSLLASIQKSVERCSDVTHRLLGFAKRMEIRRETIYLDKLIEEVVGFQRNDIVHRRIKVDCTLPEDLPPITSDRGKLQQVFLNILSNALAAIEDEGSIDIRATQTKKDLVAVVIRDDGTGISDRDLKNIFEPFYSTKGEFGTGLGLSITRDIVGKLGGTIEVQSKLGRGTSFIVNLPIKPKDFQE